MQQQQQARLLHPSRQVAGKQQLLLPLLPLLQLPQYQAIRYTYHGYGSAWQLGTSQGWLCNCRF
jgi:hypothetical protein